jgi:hypothetical protein
MTRIVLKSKVGADGILQLTVPVGPDEANREVRVVIESEPAPATRQEYLDFLQATAGAWQGDFERPEQGEYEVRDPW